MERYDYLFTVKEDVKQWIEEHDEWRTEHTDKSGKWLRDDNRDDIEQDLNDRLFVCDTNYLSENGAEACDVTIRCYLLGQAISEVLDELTDIE